MYRFRSIERLLGNNELQDQYMYFASQDELNDPMEGFRDIFWSGDKIVWINLFKHYFFCLNHVVVIQLLKLQHCELGVDDIPIFNHYEDMNQSFKSEFQPLFTEFLVYTSEYIEKVSKRTTKVGRNELLFHLNAIHSLATSILQKKYMNKETDATIYEKMNSHIAVIEEVEKTLLTHPDRDIGVLFDKCNDFIIDSTLALSRQKSNLENFKNDIFISIDFPRHFINRLESLAYPKWYAACFMEECTNSSVWGHYADGHKGVCLMFENESTDLQFHKIIYSDNFEPINFFTSLGRITEANLISSWYSDEHGNISHCAKEVNDNREQWREQYWSNFYKNINQKTTDWEYEKEYRLIHSPLMEDTIPDINRKLYYDFKILKGIVFGIRTLEKDKLEIIKIIEQKCSEIKRDNFEYYQAYHSLGSKNIQIRKIFTHTK